MDSINCFLWGVFFGLVLGVTIFNLIRTTDELEESQAIDRLIEHQDATIKRQREIIKRLKKGANNGTTK